MGNKEGELSGSRRSGACPRCGSAIERVPRDAADRFLGRFRETRRYRCVDLTGCGWTDLVEHGAARARRESRTARRVTWVLASVAVAVAAAEVARPLVAPMLSAEAQHSAAPTPVLRGLPPGAHLDGTPVALPAGSPPAPQGIGLRRNCVWGEPGRNPYKGGVEEALQAARLPPEVVKQIASHIKLGLATDRIAISRNGIATVDGRRRFDPLMHSMAFGRSVCLDTVVNFAPGHVEEGPLYEAIDRQGRSYTVVVPDVCGNVAVLSEYPEEVLAAAAPGEVAGERAEAPAEEASPPPPESGRITPPPQGGRITPPPPSPGEEPDDGRSSRKSRPPPGVPPRTPPGSEVTECCTTNTVPEPGTWLLVGAGLLALAASRRRR